MVILVGACILFLSASNAHSAIFVADFTTTTQFDSTPSDTGVWNTGEGRLRADLVSNGVALNFSGDGSDGAFNDGPAQTGITIAAGVITFNTGVKAEYQFTTFNLSGGFSIAATGANPLTIRVQGATTLAGNVNIDGTAGNPNSRTIGLIAGGATSAGGGQGGSAGFGTTNPGTAGTSGNPTTGASTRGGSPGANILAVYGDSRGGGGGCNGRNLDANDAANAPFSGGAAGACTTTRADIANQFETAFLGGAGGGGGGGFVDQGSPASSVTGASGGGGGGALHLASGGAITINGTMSANGGTGGANDADSAADPTTCGGAGGGGSGGSFWFQTLDSINVTGAVNVNGGAKGTSAAACGTDYDGGKGSIGVIRVDTPSGVVAGATVTKTISMPTELKVFSKAISMPSGSVLGTPTETIDTSASGCGSDGTILVIYEGSNDGVTFTNPVPKAQISELNGFSSIRFKVSIFPTGPTPPCLTALSIPYDERASSVSRELTDLEIKGGLFCGNVDSESPKNAGGDLLLIALSSLVALLNGSFFKKRALRFF